MPLVIIQMHTTLLCTGAVQPQLLFLPQQPVGSHHLCPNLSVVEVWGRTLAVKLPLAPFVPHLPFPGDFQKCALRSLTSRPPRLLCSPPFPCLSGLSQAPLPTGSLSVCLNLGRASLSLTLNHICLPDCLVVRGLFPHQL